MSLPDNFQEDDRLALAFPCCACKHRGNKQDQGPCRNCKHNLNAQQDDDSISYQGYSPLHPVFKKEGGA